MRDLGVGMGGDWGKAMDLSLVGRRFCIHRSRCGNGRSGRGKARIRSDVEACSIAHYVYVIGGSMRHVAEQSGIEILKQPSFALLARNYLNKYP